jgi:hypothetical protein
MPVTQKKVPNLDSVIKDNWVTRYDADSDALYLTEPILSKSARIKYVNDELAFYLTPKNKVEGIFIEYFTSNYIQHHQGLKSVMVEVKSHKTGLNPIIKLSRISQNSIVKNIQNYSEAENRKHSK